MTLAWLVAHDVVNSIIVTDSQRTLHKTNKKVLQKEWVHPLWHSNMMSLTRIYCPGHVGVYENEMVDRLAGEANIKGRL